MNIPDELSMPSDWNDLAGWNDYHKCQLSLPKRRFGWGVLRLTTFGLSWRN
jgi:hypothetical protein